MKGGNSHPSMKTRISLSLLSLTHHTSGRRGHDHGAGREHGRMSEPDGNAAARVLRSPRRPSCADRSIGRDGPAARSGKHARARIARVALGRCQPRARPVESATARRKGDQSSVATLDASDAFAETDRSRAEDLLRPDSLVNTPGKASLVFHSAKTL